MTPSPASAKHAPPVSLVRNGDLLEEECPWCEQPITREKLSQIEDRIRSEQEKKAKELESHLRKEFDATRQKEREDAERVATELKKQLVEAERSAVDREAQARATALAEAEEGKRAAVAEAMAAAEEATQKLATAEAGFAERETAARQAGREAAVIEHAEHLQRVTADKDAAATALAETSKELEDARRKLEDSERESTAKLEEARAEARTKATSEFGEKLSSIQSERDQFAKEKADIEQRYRELEVSKQASVDEAAARAAQEVRDALGKEHHETLAKRDALAFADKQKLQKSVDELTRKLDAKTAEELGEGAEVDLYNVLLADFPADEIKRIKKGEAGADIRQVVRNDEGQTCGTILWDSKNRNQWRTTFATKLRADQRADKADHAIVVSRAFPARTSQLCIQEGVIVVNPLRASVVGQLLRSSMIELHRLRMSAKERQEKTAALYDFIASPEFTRCVERYVEIADKLGEIDAKEKKGHERVWLERGTQVQALAQATAGLNMKITAILQS